MSFTAPGIGTGSEYRLIAWLHDPGKRGPVSRFEVVDTLAGEHLPHGADNVFRAGPLVAVPAQRAQSAPR